MVSPWQVTTRTPARSMASLMAEQAPPGTPNTVSMPAPARTWTMASATSMGSPLGDGRGRRKHAVQRRDQPVVLLGGADGDATVCGQPVVADRPDDHALAQQRLEDGRAVAPEVHED